jgi:hypothetical protein
MISLRMTMRVHRRRRAAGMPKKRFDAAGLRAARSVFAGILESCLGGLLELALDRIGGGTHFAYSTSQRHFGAAKSVAPPLHF